jgi:hypothetical protein
MVFTVKHTRPELIENMILQWTLSLGEMSFNDIHQPTFEAASLGDQTSKSDFVLKIGGWTFAFDHDGSFYHSKDGMFERDIRKCQRMITKHPKLFFHQDKIPRCPTAPFRPSKRPHTQFENQ